MAGKTPALSQNNNTALSQLSAATTAATALSNIVLVSPQKVIGYQPQNPTVNGYISVTQPPPAFLFHYEGEQVLTAESDITDHYVEDNTAVQDQIALKPEMFVTHGFIGELNNVPPAFLSLAKTVVSKLTNVVSYTPKLTTTAAFAYNEAFQLYQVAQNAANSAVSAWQSITNTGGENVIGSNGQTTKFSNQTKQQAAFQALYGYWRTRTLFTIQTPWAVFQNMAIYKLRAIQDTETDSISDFEVTFKMIRVAQTETVGIQISYGNQLNSQAAQLKDIGTSAPTPAASLQSSLGTMGVA